MFILASTHMHEALGIGMIRQCLMHMVSVVFRFAKERSDVVIIHRVVDYVALAP